MSDQVEQNKIEPRKASEVIIALEQKIDRLTGIVNLYDFNLKTILNKVNQTHTLVVQILNAMPLTDLQKQQIEHITNHLKHPEAVEVPKGVPVEVEKEPVGQRRTNRADIRITENNNTFPGFKEYAQSSEAKPEKKVPVIQKLKFSDNKDIFNADVSFLQNDKVIYKTKSNTIGKIQGQLIPGKYLVHVVKVETSTKRKYEASQTIEIPSNVSGVFELPVCVIQK